MMKPATIRKKTEIIEHFRRDRTYKEIALLLNVTPKYVSKTVCDYRRVQERITRIKQETRGYLVLLKDLLPKDTIVEGNPTFRHVAFLVHNLESFLDVQKVFTKYGTNIDQFVVWEFEDELEFFCRFPDSEVEKEVAEFYLSLPIESGTGLHIELPVNVGATVAA